MAFKSTADVGQLRLLCLSRATVRVELLSSPGTLVIPRSPLRYSLRTGATSCRLVPLRLITTWFHVNQDYLSAEAALSYALVICDVALLFAYTFNYI